MADDEPGFKRPPRATQFLKGKSGNPRGRPKGTRNLSTDIAELLSRQVPFRHGGKDRKVSRQEALLLSLYQKAIRGDVRAGETLLKLGERLTSRIGSTEKESLSQSDQTIVENFLKRSRAYSEEIES